MKKTWDDIVLERGDVSYTEPSKLRKVDFPAGVRSDADRPRNTTQHLCVDSTPLSVRLVEDLDTSEPQPKSQLFKVPDIGPSLNEYDRAHYTRRKGWVDRWHRLVSVEAKRQGLTPVVQYPVQVVVECYFGDGRKRFDWDNLSPTPKLIQDGLVHAGILENDSAKYVESGTMKALKTKGESYTLFMIIEPVRQAA